MVTPRATAQSQLRGSNQQQLLQQRRQLEESRKADVISIQKAPEKRTVEQINKDLAQADAKLKEYQELKKYYDEKKNYSAADRMQEYINAWGDVKQDISSGNIDFATAAVSASNIVSYETEKARINIQKRQYEKQVEDLKAQAKEGKIELVRDRLGNITGYREVQKVSETPTETKDFVGPVRPTSTQGTISIAKDQGVVDRLLGGFKWYQDLQRDITKISSGAQESIKTYGEMITNLPETVKETVQAVSSPQTYKLNKDLTVLNNAIESLNNKYSNKEVLTESDIQDITIKTEAFNERYNQIYEQNKVLQPPVYSKEVIDKITNLKNQGATKVITSGDNLLYQKGNDVFIVSKSGEEKTAEEWEKEQFAKSQELPSDQLQMIYTGRGILSLPETPEKVTGIEIVDEYLNYIKKSVPKLEFISDDELRNVIQNSLPSYIYAGYEGTFNFAEDKLAQGLSSLKDSAGRYVFNPTQSTKTASLIREVTEGYTTGYIIGGATTLARGAALSYIPEKLLNSNKFQKILNIATKTGGVTLTTAEAINIANIYINEGTDAALLRLIGDVSLGTGFVKTGLKSDAEAIQEWRKFTNKFESNINKFVDVGFPKGKRGGTSLELVQKKKKRIVLDNGEIVEVTSDEYKDLFIRSLENKLANAKSIEEQWKIIGEINKNIKTDIAKQEFKKLVLNLLDKEILKTPIINIETIPKVTRKTIFKQSIFAIPKKTDVIKIDERKQLLENFNNIASNRFFYVNVEKLSDSRIKSIIKVSERLNELENLRNQKKNIFELSRQLQVDKRKLRNLQYSSRIKSANKQEVLSEISNQRQKIIQVSSQIKELKQNYLSAIRSKQIQSQLTRQNSKQLSKQKVLQRQQERQKQKSLQLQQQPSLQVQQSRQLSKQKTLQRQVSGRLRTRPTRITSFGFPILSLPETKKKKKIKSSFKLKPKGKWDTVVKRGNKFVTINKKPFAKKTEARDYGSHYVGTTLRATFKPVPSTRKGLQKLPKDMRGHFFRNSLSYRAGRSKMTMRAFVEIPKARLNTPTEKAELKRARAFAKRKKR